MGYHACERCWGSGWHFCLSWWPLQWCKDCGGYGRMQPPDPDPRRVGYVPSPATPPVPATAAPPPSKPRVSGVNEKPLGLRPQPPAAPPMPGGYFRVPRLEDLPSFIVCGCGIPVPSHANFCPHCGQGLKK